MIANIEKQQLQPTNHRIDLSQHQLRIIWVKQSTKYGPVKFLASGFRPATKQISNIRHQLLVL